VVKNEIIECSELKPISNSTVEFVLSLELMLLCSKANLPDENVDQQATQRTDIQYQSLCSQPPLQPKDRFQAL
jgi:hypothetical protein